MDKLDKYHITGLITAVVFGIIAGTLNGIMTGVNVGVMIYAATVSYLVAAQYREEHPDKVRALSYRYAPILLIALLVMCLFVVSGVSGLDVTSVEGNGAPGIMISNGTPPYNVWVNGMAFNTAPSYSSYYSLAEHPPGGTVYVTVIDSLNETVEVPVTVPYTRLDTYCWILIVLGFISLAVGLFYIPFGSVFGFLCGMAYLVRLFDIGIYSLPYALIGVILSMLSLGIFIAYLSPGRD